MTKVLRLNCLGFIVLYYLCLEVRETRSDVMLPDLNNMLEPGVRIHKKYFKEIYPEYNRQVIDVTQPNPNDVFKKKMKKKKKPKKKNHNKKKDLDDNEVTEKDRRKKFRKKSRKFIKTAFKDVEDNSLESGEKKRSPVDIIVHIKMND